MPSGLMALTCPPVTGGFQRSKLPARSTAATPPRGDDMERAPSPTPTAIDAAEDGTRHLGRTLDVGCGIGRNLAALPPGSLGVDHNPTSIEVALAEEQFGEVMGRKDALPATRSTLEMIGRLGVDIVIPGHGAAFDDFDAAMARIAEVGPAAKNLALAVALTAVWVMDRPIRHTRCRFITARARSVGIM